MGEMLEELGMGSPGPRVDGMKCVALEPPEVQHATLVGPDVIIR